MQPDRAAQEERWGQRGLGQRGLSQLGLGQLGLRASRCNRVAIER
jgi:hypothetical protein